MPIPSQNDFLLPFLESLADGQSHPRAQLMYGLAQHFAITEAEAQAMSGNQFTLVSRLAWCIDDHEFQYFERFVSKLFSDKVRDDPDPAGEIAARLAKDDSTTAKGLSDERGLTVHWLLGM